MADIAAQDIYIKHPGGSGEWDGRKLVARAGQPVPPHMRHLVDGKMLRKADENKAMQSAADDKGAYDDMNVAQLRSLAETRGIDHEPLKRKADLIDALEADDQE